MADVALAGEPVRKRAGAERYRRLELLGSGTLGHVYRARDLANGTEVALKTLDALGADALYRLKHEFRTLATIRHPSLVRLHELVVDDDDCFFTMELVDGTDIVSFVRGADAGGPAGLARLVDAAAQLAEALAAVHRAARLHRDVKPANVRVTRDGRVVLLDFDLALDLDTARLRSDDSCIGTFAYMAPEQAFGGRLMPAADWYAYGSLVYEAVTGRLPFEGSIRSVLVAKGQGGPPPPRHHAPALPQLLDALVTALLHPVPGERPGYDEIRNVLVTLGARMRDVTASAPRKPFVGRARERATVERALERADGRMAVVHVHGPSGIGKSELVRRVLHQVEEARGALVLAGRCHDRESVPYKAFDTIVDGLADVVGRLPPDEQTRLLPADAAALVRLFPVLGRIPTMRGASEALGDLEPAEIRRRAFDALRALLAGLARTRSVVLWIDDLQWADVDSGALLEALARPPDPPGLGLVLSYRTQDRARVPLLAMLRAMPDAAAVRETEVVVPPLSVGETAELARAMAPPGAAAAVERVAEEAAGSPFFVGEIMRYLAREGSVGGRPLTLEDAIRERIGRLGPDARALLEVAAVAGGPIDAVVALEASGGPRQRATMHLLEDEALVCSTALADRVVLEVYHDRLRELVAGMLPAERRAHRHRDIAWALQQSPTADPQDLFAHWLGAGERDEARRWAIVAADAAADALAFHRAAGLYRQAIGLGSRADDSAVRLRYADALVNAGLGSDAAPEFERLAQRAERAGAPVGRVMALRRRAAEQYLQNGHLVEGTALMRQVLERWGVPLPATTTGAVARLVGEWCRLALLPRTTILRDPGTLPPSAVARLDAVAVAWCSFAVVDPLVSALMGARAAREGLAYGHRPAIIRGFASLASHQAAIGGRSGRRRSRAHLARLEPLAAASADAYDHALARTAAGVVAFCEGRWRIAHERCRRSAEYLRTCRGVAFESSLVESFALTALAYLGRLGELARELPRAIADADDRGNRVASVGLRLGMPALVWVAEDRADFAQALGDTWIAKWPRTRFFVQHYLHLVSSVYADLYRDDPAAAWSRLADTWSDVRGSGILFHKLHHVDLRFLRARTAIGFAAAGGCHEWPRERLLRTAERDARWIAKARDVVTSAPYAATLRMAGACATGDVEAADAHGARALAAFEAADMTLHAGAVRRGLGLLRGGDAGAALVRAADAAFAAEDVRQPALFASMLVPA